MAKGKMRAVAKQVKGDKQFKKLIANFLADVVIESKSYDIKEILTVGCRGYLAMTEDDLADLFDHFVKQISEDEVKITGHTSWSYNQAQSPKDRLLARADQIYDEIFERIILRANKPSGREEDERAIQDLD